MKRCLSILLLFCFFNTSPQVILKMAFVFLNFILLIIDACPSSNVLFSARVGGGGLV